MAYKLLLADDSITIQKVVELVLAEEDFEIKSVSNGEDALNAMDSFRPDIVLADIEMPKVNGYQLCEKIKQNPKTSGIPVILLAGAFEPIDEELSRTVGADDSVIKPFESQELISKINAVLTIVAAGGEEATIADEGEEVFEIAEEAEEMVAEEGVKMAGLEEDLWAMEEVPAATGELSHEAFAEEELAGAEAELELPGEETVVRKAVPEPVIAPQPGTETVTPHIVVPQIAMPSRDELLAVFEKTIQEKISASLAALDIKESVLAALMPSLKDSIDKVLWEIAPDLVEKMLRESLKNSMASLTKEVEKVIWETVPDLASTMISKEIERIKSEF
jgi:DNA-binding response OmpR family regulator